jgi:hypothetical protein
MQAVQTATYRPSGMLVSSITHQKHLHRKTQTKPNLEDELTRDHRHRHALGCLLTPISLK